MPRWFDTAGHCQADIHYRLSSLKRLPNVEREELGDISNDNRQFLVDLGLVIRSPANWPFTASLEQQTFLTCA